MAPGATSNQTDIQQLLREPDLGRMAAKLQWLARQFRHRLLLSKGHASCMLYPVLAHRRFFPPEELATFRRLNSRFHSAGTPAGSNR